MHYADSLRVVTLNSTSNAIFDPIRTEGLFLLETFFVQNLLVFRSIDLVAVPIAAFYVKTRFFALFTSFSTGAACRPRRDHRATYSSSVIFFLHFKPLYSSLGARIAQKSRKRLKSLILLWNQFRYYVIVRHANHCYDLTAAWLRPLGLNDAA
jgi:hypothetical protein